MEDPEDRSTGAPGGARRALFWFLLPLASTIVLTHLNRQALLGALAHQASSAGGRPELNIAAFVVALELAWLVGSALQGLGMLALAWGDSRAARRRLARFAGALAAVATALLACGAFTETGMDAVRRIQGLPDALAVRVPEVLGPLVLWPLLEAGIQVLNGLLKRRGRGLSLALAHVAGVAFTLSLLVLHPWTEANALRAAGWLQVGGMAVQLLVLSGLLKNAPAPPAAEEADRAPSWSRMLAFYLPVAGNTFLMLASRPLIQRFLAGELQPSVAIAAFGIATATSQLFYGYLNEIRSLAVAFRKRPEVLAKLRSFCVRVTLVTMAVLAAVAWTPLGGWLLEWGMGLHGEVLEQARAALAVFTLGPAVVALRAYQQGWSVLRFQTASWLVGGVLRIAVTVAVMVAGPWLGVHGAVLGAGALILSFLAEGGAMAWVAAAERGEAAVAAAAAD